VRTKTSPAFVFTAAVLGLLVVVAVLAVGWRVSAPGSVGDLHVTPRFGEYTGSAR
jgi:hypothetical protein